MLSEIPCQKRPFMITAKKPLLMLSEKAFSDKIFFIKFSDKKLSTQQQAHNKAQSISIQQQHTQQQYRCWLTHTAAAQQQHRCWACFSETLVLVLLYVAAVAARVLLYGGHRNERCR